MLILTSTNADIEYTYISSVKYRAKHIFLRVGSIVFIHQE